MSDDVRPMRSHRLGNAVVLGSDGRFAMARERCYGVVRAGQNDCGTAQHACAGRASRDRAGDEWVSLPAGTCLRIAGGRVKASAL